MLNQVILVGRILEINEDNTLNILVNRCYKNEEGEYETDKIKIYIWRNISENVKENCNVGDVIGIKGRIQIDKINGEMRIIAERITFLASKKNKDEDLEEDEE